VQQITNNVFVETGVHGCNHGFVITTGGIVMIDSPQMPSDALVWRDAMREKGEIRYLINTEPHRDHVTGNFFFPGTVISHEGTRQALSNVSVDAIMDPIRELDPAGLPLMEGYILKKPSITFATELFLYVGQHTFQLIHLPGHTASEIAVHIPEERVVFTGDNVFCNVQTYLNRAYPDEWLRSLARIGDLDVDVIVPGHGDICDKRYLAEQASFIREWMAAVGEAIRQGLSKEEAQTRISFCDRYPPGMGKSDARGREVQRMNVERLYDLLKKKEIAGP
jgi:cyclase